MITGALRETCTRAGLAGEPSANLDALTRMVAAVGRTGVAFVEEDVLETIIDLAISKATKVECMKLTGFDPIVMLVSIQGDPSPPLLCSVAWAV